MIFSLLPNFFSFPFQVGAQRPAEPQARQPPQQALAAEGQPLLTHPFIFQLIFYIQHKDSTSVYKTIGQGRTEALPRRSAATTTAYSSTTMEHQPAMNQNCDIHITDASAGHFDPYRHSKLNDSLSSRDLHAQECHLTRRI